MRCGNSDGDCSAAGIVSGDTLDRSAGVSMPWAAMISTERPRIKRVSGSAGVTKKSPDGLPSIAAALMQSDALAVSQIVWQPSAARLVISKRSDAT